MLIPGRIGFIAGPIIIIGMFIAMNVVGCMAAGWIENMSHRDEKLEELLNQAVKITFKDGEIKTGILERNYIGFRAYKLIVPDYNIVFAKSHVKKIEEITWQQIEP